MALYPCSRPDWVPEDFDRPADPASLEVYPLADELVVAAALNSAYSYGGGVFVHAFERWGAELVDFGNLIEHGFYCPHCTGRVAVYTETETGELITREHV